MIKVNDLEREISMPRSMLIKQEVWHYFLAISMSSFTFHHLLMSHSIHFTNLECFFLVFKHDNLLSLNDRNDRIASLVKVFAYPFLADVKQSMVAPVFR